MTYSLVGIIAVFVHLIVNFDVFANIGKKSKFTGEKYYLLFLISVILYHITDGCWGLLYDAKWRTAVYVDTVIYFFAMAASILMWGIFVNHYLGSKSVKSKVIMALCYFVFGAQISVIIVNFFVPILFTLDENFNYKAEVARYVLLGLQVLVYLVFSVFTLVYASRNVGTKRRKYVAVAMFGLFLMVAITLQAIFPLTPMYSIGYLFGTCILHTAVVRDEMVNRQDALDKANYLVATDPLTGAQSKHAYVDAEEAIEKKINDGEIQAFAVVVFDLNDLKYVNDTYGHEEGDNYLRAAVEMIRQYFADVAIYRFGGDEFVVLLFDDNYQKRKSFLKSFNDRIDQNLLNHDRIIIAAGMSDFIPDKDASVIPVFTRADALMYDRKQQLKNEKA